LYEVSSSLLVIIGGKISKKSRNEQENRKKSNLVANFKAFSALSSFLHYMLILSLHAQYSAAKVAN